MLKNHFNDFEMSQIILQNAALEVNELKNKGVTNVPIDSYLGLLESLIDYVRGIGDVVTKHEEERSREIESHNKKVNELLEFIDSITK